VQQREDAVVQMQVIREAVHQHDRRTVAGVVADMEAVPFERHRACLERTAGGHRTARGDDGGIRNHAGEPKQADAGRVWHAPAQEIRPRR
jgi:hypothetical protein